MVTLKKGKQVSVCPSCGSSACGNVLTIEPRVVCPKCLSVNVVGVVRERSLDLALVE